MRPAAHVRLFVSSVVIWALFWIAGWPDYYQQYSFTVQLVAVIALIPPIAWGGAWFIRKARPERRPKLSVWLALYATAPFALLDTLYCGVHLGHGASFVTRFWYLSLFYVLPWLLFLPVGFRSLPQQDHRQPGGGQQQPGSEHEPRRE